MFRNLTDFGYRRTPVQAIGFYVAYLIAIIIVGGLFGSMAGIMTTGDPFAAGLLTGNIVAVTICLVLSVIILKAKGLLHNFSYLLVAALSVMGAYYVGGVLGLIPTAFLTTR